MTNPHSSKLHAIPRLFFTVAGLSMAVAIGGLAAMQSLGLPPHTLVPHPITFALMLSSVTGLFGVISAALTERKPSQPLAN